MIIVAISFVDHLILQRQKISAHKVLCCSDEMNDKYYILCNPHNHFLLLIFVIVITAISRYHLDRNETPLQRSRPAVSKDR